MIEIIHGPKKYAWVPHIAPPTIGKMPSMKSG